MTININNNNKLNYDYKSQTSSQYFPKRILLRPALLIFLLTTSKNNVTSSFKRI